MLYEFEPCISTISDVQDYHHNTRQYCKTLKLSSKYDQINGYYSSQNEHDDWSKIIYKHKNGSETIAYSDAYGWTVIII